MTIAHPLPEPRGFVRTTLEPAGLVLRPWGPELADLAESLIAAGADPEITRWNPLPIKDRADAEKWLERCASRWDNGAAAIFAILDAADGTLLGNSNLRWVDQEDGLAMIGYWLLPAARGRGIATTVTKEVTGWGIRTAGTRRIELAHAVGNDPSCRVAERCGFPYEGTLRESHKFNGVYLDEHLHARLATDPL